MALDLNRKYSLFGYILAVELHLYNLASPYYLGTVVARILVVQGPCPAAPLRPHSWLIQLKGRIIPKDFY